MYGKELIIDMYGCDPEDFSRTMIDEFFEGLCKEINMVQCERYFWDDLGVPESERQTSPHTKGTSAVQFILTSNITTHTLDMVGELYLNIFSCKDFDSKKALKFCTDFWEAMAWDHQTIIRGRRSLT